MLFGIGAYLLWGVFPAFFPLLTPAGAGEILAHRVIWSALLMVIILTATRGWGELTRAGARTWALMATAGVLIAGNWLLYITAVNSGHVADAALGYFINPLVSVLLGVLVLRERLRRLQLAAVLIAAAAVAYLTVSAGQPPLIALSLALTFGLYGLLKKAIPVSPIPGLTAETLAISPVAVAYLVWLDGTFTTEGPGHAALMVSSGVVTVLPLLLFAAGARRLSLTSIGMLQYLTPTMQMLWALFVVGEQLSAERWVGFVVIWVAVAIFLADILRQRSRRD